MGLNRCLLGGLATVLCGLIGGLSGSPAWAQGGPMPVDVAPPRVETIVDWDEYTGRFEAVERVELRARVSGYLQQKLFRDGQKVSRGDVLYVIDPRVFDAEYARAAAQLASARAEQTRAATELERGEQLVRNRTVSETTLDDRIAVKLRADAEVAVAEAALRVAGLNLEFTEVKAPFDGRISDSRVDIGNLVSVGETVLATIVSTDPIHLVFTASEADFLKYSRLSIEGIRPSSRTSPNTVEAKLIDEETWAHIGTMDFVANEIDPNAGTITGRAIMENPDGILTPGLFARLRLIGSGEYEALMIPDSAVLSDQSRKIVMVVEGENTVAARVVKLGPLYRGLRVIREGLTAEDRVIVNGVMRARPGGQVVPEPVEIAFPEALN
ncbi:MAG: efflux RND transporter periplasmic adaptor subunit [Pseudomonadota bacterium]